MFAKVNSFFVFAMGQLIYLTDFRKDNKITQQELADFLGTTRSYLSLVESGKSKLADDKIDKIYCEGRTLQHWDVKKFNPTYFRLYELALYIDKQTNGGYPVVFNWSTGENLLYLTSMDIDHVRYGKATITDNIINELIKQTPNLNPDWLKYGYGKMILEDESQKGINTKKNTTLSISQEELYKISSEIIRLEHKLNDLTDILDILVQKMQNNCK